MRIKIGKCYIATLTKGEAPVRIESTHEDGGWVARTLLTSRTTRIKTADQIVRECEDAELAEYTNRVSEQSGSSPETGTEEIPVDLEPVVASPTGGSTEDIYDVLRRKPKRTLSLLDAAYRVLTEFGDELSANDLVQAILQKGYWRTEGKTPGNTLNAAMTREIKVKGEESRFAKGARGRFLARPK